MKSNWLVMAGIAVAMLMIVFAIDALNRRYWAFKMASNEQAAISHTRILLQVLSGDVCESGGLPQGLRPAEEVVPLIPEKNLEFYSAWEIDGVHILDYWGSPVKVLSCNPPGCIQVRSLGSNQRDESGGGDDIVETVFCK